MERKPESPQSDIRIGKQFAADVHESWWPRAVRVSSASMFTKSLQIGLIGLFVCISSAWAGPSSIQGIVKDAKGQPIKGADVRIESRDGKQLFGTVKTDAKGRYISQGLAPGVYRVALIVNGAVKASITNTKTKADRATQLNFDLKPVAASQASGGQKTGKHMVWVPSSTGTHTGGRWVEVPDGASDAGALNIKKASADELQREQLRLQGLPPSNPSGGGGP
jgi:Carboxypeptidase regulatory-like domain